MMMEEDELPMILCPLCGTQTKSTNAASICNECLKNQVDITEGISKQVTIFYCKLCTRYLGAKWMAVKLESRELLALCLKKIKGLNKDVKLIDASFIWTEPHSLRIKVKLTVQKAVYNVIMQQSCVVEFVVHYQQCPDCQASFTEHTWTAVVQVRQKVKHKRTFFWVEQQLLKHRATDKVQNIKEQPDGLDFYFGSKSNAEQLVSFLTGIVPIKKSTAKRLISSDLSSNTHKFKFTFLLLISPICRDDLIILPNKLRGQLGGIGPIVLCTKVTGLLRLTDPRTLQEVELDATKYFRHNFEASLGSTRLTTFVVLDVEKQSPNSVNPHAMQSNMSLAEATIVRESDFGVNDNMYTVITHLGNLLQPGDHVLGYDLEHTNLASSSMYRLKDNQIPDVILVKKTYPDRKNRARRRKWKLKQLNKERMDVKKHELKREVDEYEKFMQDIEEDPEMWKDAVFEPRQRTDSIVSDATMDNNDDDDGFPGIQLEKMLSSMQVD